jgi:hypothetical protein
MMRSERPERAGRVPQAQLSSVSEPYGSSVTLSRTIFLTGNSAAGTAAIMVIRQSSRR